MIALVGHIFPAAVLEESFAERLVFSVPQSAVSSLARCFQQIEDGKWELNILAPNVGLVCIKWSHVGRQFLKCYSNMGIVGKVLLKMNIMWFSHMIND